VAREYVLQPFQPAVNPQIDYAGELNPQQHAAVTAPPGPCLVIAGAGSGKTRTLTYRVAFLLEQGIPPERILLLTFTNKAAREMMRRVASLLGTELRSLWGGTFHSIGARLLRQNAEVLGFRRDFTILDREDARDLVKACTGEPDFGDRDKFFPKPEVLVDILSLATNKYSGVEEAVAQEYAQFVALTPRIVDLARRYKARKQASNVMDFDDLLTRWLQLLEEHPDVLDRYQRQFQFILVDEYQDTNTLQGRLIDLLAARHHNLMVVGDDSQSIYSWRGANFRNILEFPKRYPEAKTFKIETNYRSTPEILELANAAIAANRNQFEKRLASARRNGMKPVLVPCADAAIQAAFIGQRILQLHEEGIALNEIAILYRSHFHAMELQLELTRRQIPFSITSGIRFFEQAHIKDISTFLRLVANPLDEIAFKRIVQMLPGVGAKAADKLWGCFRSRNDTPPAAGAPIATALEGCRGAVPKKAAVAWAQLTATLSQVEPLRARPAEMIPLLLEGVYEDYLAESYDNHQSRLEDVQQLATFAHQFEDLETFLGQLSLMTSVDAEEDTSANADEERVRLTTIHQAKGLEFGAVFVIMLCDGLFPSNRSLNTAEGEEEERRLFYVAVTRARDELYLTYPLLRYMPGAGEAFQQPSRFLGELPRELIEEWNLRQSGFGGGPF
jgi:DNA helicase-2/ATP-dependent DNA helicase PcrA